MKELSLTITTGGTSHTLTLVASTSQQTAALNCEYAIIYCTVDCFVRRGSNPTALADGTDQFIPANTLLRIDGWAYGDKLAVISASAGTFRITQGA